MKDLSPDKMRITTHYMNITSKLTRLLKLAVTEDNFNNSLVGRKHASEITNAPTFVDSF